MVTFKELKRNLKKDLSTLPSLNVSLLGDSATQLLSTAIRGMGVDRGYNINLYEAEYNQIEQQIFDHNSCLHQHQARYTIIFQSTHKLLELYTSMPEVDQANMARDRIEFIRIICKQVTGHIIYYNYPEIDDSVFGAYANKVQTSFLYQLRKLNYELMNLAQEYRNFFICDLSTLQNTFGRNLMFDSKVYVGTDILMSIDILPYVASRTMDIICSVEGKFKKCIILDLDNTLWGGIVGDDGWENIQIGHGLGIGKAFTEFQEWIKRLKNRGIIVCVCSKNDEDKAKEPFIKNPEMVLKLEDISVFIANWENKADNIREIQRILNISFDSMVFIDDNPFERSIVRENINGIIVPEIPVDPGDYLEYLYSLNLFETASFSEEDRNRTKQYQVEASRSYAAKSFANEEDFLKSLNMVCDTREFDEFNIPRIAQLSQRSNQFNLRTVRYTEDQVVDIRQNQRYATFSYSLRDRFGDNGLIAVAILEKMDSDVLFINTWFMSCRVLKRGVENFMLNTLVEYARKNKFKKIIGEYLPTAKNNIVKDHYMNLGFEEIKFTQTSQWLLTVDSYRDKTCFITKL